MIEIAQRADPEVLGLRLDVQAVRAGFPVLSREVNGHRLVYLDSAATSQKPEVVIEAMNHYYRWYNANIHRGIYRLAEEATQAYEQARIKAARFINAVARKSASSCATQRRASTWWPTVGGGQMSSPATRSC